jgi:hypothetical protein
MLLKPTLRKLKLRQDQCDRDMLFAHRWVAVAVAR